MRLNSNSDLRSLVSVYLDGIKEPDAMEVYIVGNTLEGKGYVVRGVRDHNGKLTAAVDVDINNLSPFQREISDLLCEKVEGNIRIEIADDESSIWWES